MEERTGWRGQSESQTGGEEKKNGRLYGVAETSKERAEWRRLQRKNWSKLGLPKRKEWPQCHRESSWQERRSRPCQKEKEQSRLSRVPGHEGGESQGGREPHLGESEGDQSEAIIFRLRDFVDTEKLKFLYYSLIYSHVQYGIILWGKAINTRQKEIVLRLHNIVRIMI